MLRSNIFIFLEFMEIETGKKTPLKVTIHHTPEQLLEIHEELAALHRGYEQKVNYFKSKVKAFVSLTKGEGYGRPLAEFALSKKPIITTNWSGHTDFLSPDYTILLPGELKPCHPSTYAKGLIIEGASWFAPDHGAVSRALQDVFENYNKYEALGKRQGHKIKTEFNYDNMVLLLKSYLENYVPNLPKLVLPQLKKIQLPKLKKIE